MELNLTESHSNTSKEQIKILPPQRYEAYKYAIRAIRTGAFDYIAPALRFWLYEMRYADTFNNLSDHETYKIFPELHVISINRWLGNSDVALLARITILETAIKKLD